jgi:hypothetical protein
MITAITTFQLPKRITPDEARYVLSRDDLLDVQTACFPIYWPPLISIVRRLR